MSVNTYVTTPLVPMCVIVVLDMLLILMEEHVEVSVLHQLMQDSNLLSMWIFRH